MDPFHAHAKVERGLIDIPIRGRDALQRFKLVVQLSRQEIASLKRSFIVAFNSHQRGCV